MARFVPQRGKLVVTFLGLVMFMAAAVYVMIEIGSEELRNEAGLWRLALWAVLVGCPAYAADTLARLAKQSGRRVGVVTDVGLFLHHLAKKLE